MVKDMDRLRARMLLFECTGCDIWPVAYCQQQRVPQSWIDELADCFESGFRSDRETVYYDEKVVNQFHGVHDLRLAYRFAALLGVDVPQTIALMPTPEAEVRALQQAVEDEY